MWTVSTSFKQKIEKWFRLLETWLKGKNETEDFYLKPRNMYINAKWVNRRGGVNKFSARSWHFMSFFNFQLYFKIILSNNSSIYFSTSLEIKIYDIYFLQQMISNHENRLYNLLFFPSLILIHVSDMISGLNMVSGDGLYSV